MSRNYKGLQITYGKSGPSWYAHCTLQFTHENQPMVFESISLLYRYMQGKFMAVVSLICTSAFHSEDGLLYGCKPIDRPAVGTWKEGVW